MRTGKELILATRAFTKEDRGRSWIETFLTIALISMAFPLTFVDSHLFIRLSFSVLCALLYVRMFVIYHDYQHHAILQGSRLAQWIMQGFGVFILAPQNIWKRSHDHHHSHNSKLTLSGIGSYPTICKDHFARLTKKEQDLYLLNRHPLTVILGYFTLFIFWLNVKSLIQSPKKHMDSLLALVFHFSVGYIIFSWFGGTTFLLSWFLPFFVAFALGSYLFYSQHNFPEAKFCENHDWTYDNAALASTSFMVMNPVLNWLTGNIGYHHVHHMNSKIPFYRLKETMQKMPELQQVQTTTLRPTDVIACFRLKLWDGDRGRMISLNELR